jgi:hypothetical protein
MNILEKIEKTTIEEEKALEKTAIENKKEPNNFMKNFLDIKNTKKLPDDKKIEEEKKYIRDLMKNYYNAESNVFPFLPSYRCSGKNYFVITDTLSELEKNINKHLPGKIYDYEYFYKSIDKTNIFIKLWNAGIFGLYKDNEKEPFDYKKINYIIDEYYEKDNEYSWTFEMICEGLGVSPSYQNSLKLKKLHKANFIKKIEKA